MKPLFISFVCDYCDGLAPREEEWDEGFVVWRGRPLPLEDYVFASREDAEAWARYKGVPSPVVVPVRAPVKFRWRKSTGSVKGLTMADRLVTLYPDRRFTPGPNRAVVDRA